MKEVKQNRQKSVAAKLGSHDSTVFFTEVSLKAY